MNWFPTSKGLVVVNPNEVRLNQLPPPMALDEVLVDGQRVTNASPSLRILPGRNRSEFHYAALSLVAPEKVQFKYRVEGLEKDWMDAGAKRVVNYSFVPPGDYVFHVIAANNNGVWNETGVALPFTVLPHFWQTWWFHFFGGLMAVVIVSAGVWFETRRRLLTVSDSGRGIALRDPVSKPPTNPDRIMHGHGLPNMKRRLAEIGGACEVQGVAGQGTTVTFHVPLRG